MTQQLPYNLIHKYFFLINFPGFFLAKWSFCRKSRLFMYLSGRAGFTCLKEPSIQWYSFFLQPQSELLTCFSWKHYLIICLINMSKYLICVISISKYTNFLMDFLILFCFCSKKIEQVMLVSVHWTDPQSHQGYQLQSCNPACYCHSV